MIVLNHKDLQNLMLKNLDGQIAKCTNLYLNLWCKCRIKMKVGVQEEKKKYFQSYASRAKILFSGHISTDMKSIDNKLDKEY